MDKMSSSPHGQGVVVSADTYSSARQRRDSGREVVRGNGAPTVVEGRGTAGGQTTSGSDQEAVMRNGRKRRISSNPAATKHKKPSRRGSVGACGFRVHGETSDWQDPCDRCGGVSHKDNQLCFACHREPSRDQHDNPVWRHFQPGVVDAAREWWAAARNNSRLEHAVRSDYEPNARCICNRSDCVFHMYDIRKRNCRCCDTCGSRKTVLWRKAGVSYGYLRNFFTDGKGATKTTDYLARNGGSITTESDICNKCWLAFRDNAESTKTTTEAYIAVLEAQPIGRLLNAQAERRVSLSLLRHLRAGEVVSLERCKSMLHDERQRAGAAEVGGKHLLRSARELMDDLADRVEDADVRQFSPSEFDHLYDNDNSKTHTYLAPTVLSLKYVVQLELNNMSLEKELKKQHTASTGAVGGSAEPTQGGVV